MKKKQALALAAQAVEMERGLVSNTPLTYRTLTICWSKRTVDIDGHVYDLSEGADYFSMPLLSTERPLMSRGGRFS